MQSEFDKALKHLCSSVTRSLDNFDRENILEAVNTITEANQVFVYGSGRSGLVGRSFAMRLMQIGLRAFFIGETITPSVKDGDCVVFISKTGETQTAIQAAKIVRDRVDATNIIVTASPEATLSKYGDIIIKINLENSPDDPKYAPLGTIFEDSTMIFLDALIAVLMEELNESEEGMEYRHPILI
ncbi:MAG: SIS domain-containing protein [Thermoplasmata archaeon]